MTATEDNKQRKDIIYTETKGIPQNIILPFRGLNIVHPEIMTIIIINITVMVTASS